jgi:hypothetical protein
LVASHHVYGLDRTGEVMCGIMGWTFHANCPLTLKQRAKLLQIGAVGADKRGGQSFGTLTLDDAGLPTVAKGLGALCAVDFEALAASNLGFAHSRFSTRGAITVANSHPFEQGKIIGAHNGVIDNADHKFDVDSMALFDNLDRGVDFSELRGYGVIEWYDKETPGILFLSNIGRGSVTLFELGYKNKWGKRKPCGYFWTSVESDGELAIEGAGLTPRWTVTMKEGEAYMLRRNKQVYSVAGLKLKLGTAREKWEWKSTGYTGSYSRRDFHSPYDWEDEKTNPLRDIGGAYACDAGALGDGKPEQKPRKVPDGFRPQGTKARTAGEIAEDAAWAELETRINTGEVGAEEMESAVSEILQAFPADAGEKGGES